LGRGGVLPGGGYVCRGMATVGGPAEERDGKTNGTRAAVLWTLE